MDKKPTSVIWPALSVPFILRGIGAAYGWLKHGFALSFLDWPQGFRIVQFILGVVILAVILRRQYLLRQSTSSQNPPS